jgi:hypothetical protein
MGNQFNNSSRDFESGFMTIENPFPGDTFANVFTNPKKKSVSEIRSDIENTLTASEYKTLIGTRFISDKDTIIKYRDILTKLIDAGVFDDKPSFHIDFGVSDNKTNDFADEGKLRLFNPAPNDIKPTDYSKLIREAYELNPDKSASNNEFKPDWSILNTPKIEVSTVSANGDASYYCSALDDVTTNVTSPVEDVDNKETSKSETTDPTDPTYPYTGSYIEITITPSDKKEYDRMLHDINDIFVGNGNYIENFLLVSTINEEDYDKIVITLCLDCFRDGADTFARLNKAIENVINKSKAESSIRFRYKPPTDFHATELVKFAEKSIKILVYMSSSGDDVILTFSTGINRTALKQVIFMCIDVNNALKNNNK